MAPYASLLVAVALACTDAGCATAVANVVPPPPSALDTLPPDSPARPFLGTYRWVGGTSELSQIDKAIDDAVAPMSPIIREFAHNRLIAANHVAKKLYLLADTRWFEVQADGWRYVSHYDGTPYKVETSTGDVMDLHYEFGQTLQQAFSDEAKSRVNTFELQDKRLIMHVRVRANVLPKEINYDLTYERVDPIPAPPATATASPAQAKVSPQEP